MPTWSGTRRKLEQNYLAESLQGHIQYYVTTYRKSHDQEGKAVIRLNGKPILSGCYWNMGYKEYIFRTHVNADTLEKGAFDQHSFYDAFAEFDNQSIEESLRSENLLVRIFAILDRRTGKRRLQAMQTQMESEPDILQTFYHIRMQYEKIEERG